jgi:HSP20 family protein
MVFRSLIPHRSTLSPHPAWGARGPFDDVWPDLRFAPAVAPEFAPRIDVRETDDAILVTAELPGLEAEDFDVTLDEDLLTLKGKKVTNHDESGEGYTHVERTSGSFSRSFRIPWELSPDSVTAAYKNGVLTLTVARPAEVQTEPRTIPVETS